MLSSNCILLTANSKFLLQDFREYLIAAVTDLGVITEAVLFFSSGQHCLQFNSFHRVLDRNLFPDSSKDSFWHCSGLESCNPVTKAQTVDWKVQFIKENQSINI